ncbi:MAG: SDR family NAD(P)-dependent oxidoreductase [Desulfobacter sp.]|nr:SDR family NAD(P)-dependent oxidoreductase [Desulfobacter sp.]
MAPKKTNMITQPIAIIGMGCIFPESRNLKEYWHLLFNGIDAIKPIPEDSHWQLKDYYDSDPACPDHTYCTRGGFIPPVAFDPLRYGMPPKNIQATDTSQLLGLEVARMALADAGYPVGNSDIQDKKVNVILGVTGTQELVIPLGARLGHPVWKKAMEDAGIDPAKTREILQRMGNGYAQWQENSFPGLLGNVVAGRIANRLNLSGTNCVSDAACASSLSAVHMAIMELESGRCDMSITGGVDTLNDIFMHMCFSKTGVLSHTSDAKPFSKDADGTVLGEGIGMLVLKRLADAEKDKDRIYAVIRGMGTSSDGKTSAVYAPEAKGQVRALKEAYETSGIDPFSVGLIEAHGTGTRVGDKVEFTALKTYFSDGARHNTTAVGSVKSMIGHTKASAGAAGLIKSALALHHKVIPPTLKAEVPDPELDINNSAFYLNSSSKPWIQAGKSSEPRRSGVSAFGFGGSNFHAVLEEYQPEKRHVSWDGAVQIIAASADDLQTLSQKLGRIRDKVAAHDAGDEVEYSQALAWQAGESRHQFSSQDEYRILILVLKKDCFSDLMDQALEAIDKQEAPIPPVFFGKGKPDGKLGFVFPGQGSQYTGMGKSLISFFPEAMDALKLGQSCMEKINLEPETRPLSEYIYPLPEHVQDKNEAQKALRKTQIAQPAIGAVSLAMIQILKRFKIAPEMTCGHSFGELSALYAAGWMDQKSFLELSAARGYQMAQAGKQGEDPGSMLAIQAPIETIQALVEKHGLDLVLANKNSHTQGVLSGSTSQIDRAKKICKQEKVRAVKLPVAAAFHSALVEKATGPFKDFLSKKILTPTHVDVLSNTTGKSYPRNKKESKDLLGNQLMHPVNFIDDIEYMHEKGVSTFLEIGPKTVLSGLIRSILKDEKIQAWALDNASGKDSGLHDLGTALCRVAASGYGVDLRCWEDPALEPEIQKMKLMLSGANPKPEEKSIPPVAQPLAPEAQPLPLEVTQDKNLEESGPCPDVQNNLPLDLSDKQGNIMTPSSHPHTTNPQSSLGPQNVDLLQKGLETMQQLQAQTARAHEKFLETQVQASQTLAAMMEQTRGIAPDNSYPKAQYPAPVTPVPEPVVTEERPRSQMPTPLESDIPQTAVPSAKAFVPETPQMPLTDSEPPMSVKPILFEIVSRLTGFPQEMLEPDMDIESDLGIDSIKKVEIISELEKQMPAGQTLSSDHLSSVRTLKDIYGAMAGDDASETETVIPNKGAEPTPAEDASEKALRTLEVLVNIISDLTGFPTQMLEPEMNLESDLGIDSIKRVEILSQMEQELPGIRTISPDDMGRLKTIQDIVQFLIPAEQTGVSNPPKKKTSPDAVKEEALPLRSAPGGIVRQEIVLNQYPTNQIRFYNGSRIELPRDKTVYLTRDKAGIAQAFKQEFEKLEIKAALIDISGETIPDLPDAAGLVLVPNAFDPLDDAPSFLVSAFGLASKNCGFLEASAKKKGSFFATISFSGGSFGFDGGAPGINPMYGGLAGLTKTADLEWKTVLCRALDMPASIEKVKENAEAAVALMLTHGGVEMGLDGEQCAIPALQIKKIPSEPLSLGPRDVAVITGGAKGVTAECALALAKACSPRIVLLGRSPSPFKEPEWIQDLTDPGEMKKAILAQGAAGEKPTPAQIEKEYQAILSNRCIQENIDRIKAWSPQVEYYSADIRDKGQVDKIFTRITSALGPIAAVIHGAGVVEDKRIAEKKMDPFKRVFETKVTGLDAILGAINDQTLRYLVLFSSVAARMGNPGQCDYAMANEVLNKKAQTLAKEQPQIRVLSLNWGPWDGGMVNDSLKREFARRGVDLIPQTLGADQMVREMGNPDHHCVEVVIGGGMNPEPSEKKTVLNRAMTQILGPSASPIINDHRINHDPVVPFAMITDLLACAGEKNNPGLKFSGMEEMRLLKGIVPGRDEFLVQVDLGKCIPKQNMYYAPAALSSGDKGEIVHARAKLLLENTLPEPPVLSKAAFMDLKPYALSVEQAYDQVLFHGKKLHGIVSITGVSSKGIEVLSRQAKDMDQWYDSPYSKHWTIDPMMIDAAFQAAILWTYHTRNQVCLPSFFESLRLYSYYSEKKGKIRILFTVNHQTEYKVQGYFTFLDETDTVIASIMGFEAVIDSGLLDKFKPEPLFSRKKILAFAQGNPSDAFGQPYEIFDEKRQIARLPKPPYFFMDNVVRADHTPWEMRPGGWIETTYEIPDNEWYFAANRSDCLPFCILLEIALQPCGWLAAYAGSALQSNERLHFRNLGGRATYRRNLTRTSGQVMVRAKMTDVSKAGGMIIQDFEMEVLNQGQVVYQGTTNFGFFTQQALSNQVGIRESRFFVDLPAHTGGPIPRFKDDAPVTPADIDLSPDSGMPSKALRMIDCIDYFDPQGGVYEKGCVQAVKKVDANEWFFDAHFYQDPVCPGSLGVESFLQMLRFVLIETYEIDLEDYESVILEENAHEWIYRGQIIPANKQVIIQAHIKEISHDNTHYTVVADGALGVDGICIYEMKDFGIQFSPAVKEKRSSKSKTMSQNR